MSTMWREPAVESADLYPGLVVHDGRVSGSITLGRSRLPIWAFTAYLVEGGWENVKHDWPDTYGWERAEMAQLLGDVFELRGEFARLLLVLADAERCDRSRLLSGPSWWETKRHRKRVADQLKRCLAVLGYENTQVSDR